jgi:transcriptional regulator with GAF, ATPase, and Fis domain
LTLYEESQGVFNMRGVLAQMFGLPKENVRVITKFVGSGFGSKLWPWTHCDSGPGRAISIGRWTIFLDEIGEIPLELQSKLLRILQEGQFERVGEEITRRVDVRLIAATNRNLKREMEAGHFREDLYYRLSVFPIEIPPLRERIGDIPLLAAHFLQQARPRPHSQRKFRLTPDQIERLQLYDWPGNMRELQNVLERAVILSRRGPLRLDLALSPFTPVTEPTPTKIESAKEPEFLNVEDWKHRERQNILAALKRADWKIYGAGGAGALLGLKP